MADAVENMSGGRGPGDVPAETWHMWTIGVIVATILTLLLAALLHYWPDCEANECAERARKAADSLTATESASQNASGFDAGGVDAGVVITRTAAAQADGGTRQNEDRQAPIITAIEPPSGSVCGDSALSISGTSFGSQELRVFVGGAPARAVLSADETMITAFPPSRWESTVDVTVSVAGKSTTLSKAYSYVCPERTQDRLLLLVMLAGALGGALHSLRSLYFFVGNRALLTSWLGMYLALPFTGAAISTVFFLVFIAGFFAPQGSDTKSYFVIVGVAALVGMFCPQAVEKLKKISEAILTSAPPSADKVETSSSFAVRELSPKRGKLAGGERVQILGSGFESSTVVRFGASVATASFVSSTELSAEAPASSAGVVDVVVSQVDGRAFVLASAYEYV